MIRHVEPTLVKTLLVYALKNAYTLAELLAELDLVGDEEFEFAIQANFGRSAVPASPPRRGYLMAPNRSV